MKGVKIIAVVGMPGSGKGTVIDYLAETHGWPTVYFGGMVYDEVKKRGLDIVKDETFVRHDMRKIDGPAVMAVRAAKKADEFIKDGQTTIIFDGLYSWTEYKFLQEKYGTNLIVIAVVAPKALRHQRAVARRDGKRVYTIDKIIKRETDEIENMEKGGPIAYADYYINNEGSLGDLKSKTSDIIDEIGIETK